MHGTSDNEIFTLEDGSSNVLLSIGQTVSGSIQWRIRDYRDGTETINYVAATGRPFISWSWDQINNTFSAYVTSATALDLLVNGTLTSSASAQVIKLGMMESTTPVPIQERGYFDRFFIWSSEPAPSAGILSKY